MTTLQLPPITADAMTAEASFADATIAVVYSGTADTETRPLLEEFVKQLHAEAVRLSAATVKIDFRELEFMNSSCFKIFVAWLAQLRDLTPEKQYKIQIRSNPNLLWQRRSLAALSCFAVDLVTIET
ncbi:MAG: hypothetical protein ABI867_29630 [Kofleriaceae bacterium]